MSRIVIIGHTGVVGTALHHAALRDGLDVIALSRSADHGNRFDLATDDLSIELPVSAVFLCAALTNVDYCEQHPEESRTTNVDGAARIAAWCARNACRLVFFSTDYVFDGIAGPYDESAQPHPLNVYGRDKLAAEVEIARILPEAHTIVRTTIVFGPEPARKNFVLRLYDQLRAGRALEVPDDQMGTPTWSADLATAALGLVQEPVYGVVHVAGPALVSRYDFAVRAAEVLGLDARLLRRCQTASLQQAARRPLAAGLISTRFTRRMHTMDEALHAFAAELPAP